MAWTTQTHHPYEMSPGVPELNLLKEHSPDDWELGHYLNVIHETDHQLGRVFEAVRRAGLDQDTLIVIVGDHGQAFGYPHENVYIQGRTAYEEDVRVPLLFWFPRGYPTPLRSKSIAGHVDLAPDNRGDGWRAGCAGVAGEEPARRRASRTVRIFTSRRIPSRSGCAKETGSTSTTCATGRRSCTTSIVIRTSSTICRARNRSGALACGSGWRRGPRPTGGSTRRSLRNRG